jgi:predicted acyltransferase
MSARPAAGKIRALIVAGVVALVAGFALDATVTPIIKRIATTSFVLAAGGWCLLALAACYWWIDVRNHRSGWQFLTIVGMNSLFIYLFFEIVGNRWFTGYVTSITTGLLALVGTPAVVMGLASAIAVFALEWHLCRFLFRKGIFLKV